MFGFGGKKAQQPAKKPRQPRDNNLAQLGLLGMGYDDGAGGGDDDDGDLDAELAALVNGKTGKPKKAPPKVIPAAQLDAMIQSSLRDYKSDDEVSDIDDGEVEDELNELCGGDSEPEETSSPLAAKPTTKPGGQVSLLQERLAMYVEAEKNAKSSGDSIKARRFGRGVKTLQDLLKAAQAGKPVDENDIPPQLAPSTQNKGDQPKVPVAAPVPPVPPRPASRPTETAPVAQPKVPVPSPPAAEVPEAPPAAPVPTAAKVSSPELEEAIKRRNDYKQAALQAKRDGDQKIALQHVRMVKACEQLISQAEQNQLVDWSLLPPPPGSVLQESLIQTAQTASAPAAEETAKAAEPSEPVPEAAAPAVEAAAEAVAEAAKALFDVPPAPRTTLEALEQRLKKYEASQAQAQSEGNSSKQRRMGRIVKQYQDAIKLHKAGKPVPFDELPTPPGFPPIPGAPQQPEAAEPVPAVPAAAVAAPVAPPQAAPAAPAAPATEKIQASAPPAAKPAVPSRFDKQLAALVERQNMFRQAALEAKKAGDVAQAKECLKMAKGIDPLIAATQSGLPVDMATVPIPPQMKKATNGRRLADDAGDDGFVLVSSEEGAAAPMLDGENSALFQQLEADLLAQLKVCTDNRDNYKAMGDLANANRFDQLALFTRKDLDFVRSAAVRGDPLPRWKNEIRTFSIVKCCTDLKDDDMEISIVKGIAYNVANPKTVDTYVKFEVPIPNNDNPTRDKTATVKDTNNPDYNQTFGVQINRQSRTLLRIFKTKSVKFEVWSKGGFLRNDTLIGTCSVKLEHFLNHCEFHQAIDLVEGRKQVGGKVELRIRLRDPIVGKELEQLQHKWTVLVQ